MLPPIYSALTLLLGALVVALLAEEGQGAFTSPVNHGLQRKSVISSAGLSVAASRISNTYLFLASEGSDETDSSTTDSSVSLSTTSDSTPLDDIQKDLQMRWRIFQESNKQGYGFKQNMANVLAGEYNQDATLSKVRELIGSAPCVMFTWERSPSCVKAAEAFETMGVFDQIKIVRLDDPWSEGNPLRAELGKMVGRSSVPLIFIDGKYVGGFDGGVSEEAPGIQTMAFQGKLRPTLEAAGISFS